MGLKCGIIGLPNVGKSTFFNALTNSQQAEAANYPFCTIEPNLGQTLVPDLRLDKISEIINPKKTLATTLEFTDIAGLVEGASQGEGLGNKFLSHIREVDSLLHIVRVFKNDQITSVYKTVDPKRDIDVINTELLLSDLEISENRLAKIKKTAQSKTQDKKLQKDFQMLEKITQYLKKGQALREIEWEDEEAQLIQQLNLITFKPVLYVCNQEESELDKTKVEDFFEKDESVISLSCALESELSQLSKEDKQNFLKDLGLNESGLDKVIKKTYEKLNLITFFTAGEQEVRAWTVPKGSFAPQAGGVIHSDFEKGFIRSEVYSCDDLFKHKSEKELKQQGLIRSEGKDYVVQDGDVILFKFNV